MKSKLWALLMLLIFAGCASSDYDQQISERGVSKRAATSHRDKVEWFEDAQNCGSGGCVLTIKDPNGKVIFEDLTLGKPDYLETEIDGHRDFTVTYKHYLSQGGFTTVESFYRYDSWLKQYRELDRGTHKE